ncbi:MAG: hypothetical protein ACO2PP_00850 [Thermocrinis sp.]|jgi:hypothetical protein|uniref:hypothetical protein n=1 Tax=Thermocrinis sp. TaxID=2024383 RepID=UPI003C10235F
MVKWILYLLVGFLIIDHLWVHYGGPFVERLRSRYVIEEIKKNPEWQKVELEQAYKQSILDRLWDKIKQLTKKEEKNE